MSSADKATVAVAGATGFIGRSLPDALGEDYELIGLSRTVGERSSSDRDGGYRWRSADLFSRRQTFGALRGVRYAVYLVHSLRPSARLTQAAVGDLDLICADNFARAARHHGVEHIVYVRRATPRAQGKTPFLSTRADVERTLASHGTPVTTLRSPLVVGHGGDTTEVLFRLVETMAVMALPRWSRRPFAPIPRRDLARLIAFAIGRLEYAGEGHDVAGSGVTNLRQIFEMISAAIGERTTFLQLPLSTPNLVAACMSLWTGAAPRMVRPLVETLQGHVLPVNCRLQVDSGIRPEPLAPVLARVAEARCRRADADDLAERRRPALPVPRRSKSDVRAAHRLALPAGWDARRLADEYFRWLDDGFGSMIQVKGRSGDIVEFYLGPVSAPVLVFERDREVSTEERQLFWIRRGLLARHHRWGRLEFRVLLGGRFAVAAIHEFHPRLPWPVYVGTQAWIHQLIMDAFDWHLRRLRRLREEKKG